MAAVWYTVGGFLVLVGIAGLIAGDHARAIVSLLIGLVGIFVTARRAGGDTRPPPQSDEEEGLLTVDQVAARLGVRRDWVLNLVARQGIPYVRLSGWSAQGIRFKEKEIDEWLGQRDDPGRPS